MDSSETPRIPLEMLIDFPSLFVFRVVAGWSEELPQRCRVLVEEALGREIEALEHVLSGGGRYGSVRVSVQVTSADDVTVVYAALRQVPQLRMLL